MVRRARIASLCGLVAAMVAIAGLAVAGGSGPIDSNAVPGSGNAMADRLQIVQGTTADHGGARLAFAGADGRGGAKIDVWNPADAAWVTHWRLRPGQILAAGGGFLRIEDVRFGGPREVLVLATPGDSGGLAAPAASQPVLPAGGSLEVGLSRVELIAVEADGTASARIWPKLQPLAKTDPGEIREVTLAAGTALAFGSRTLVVDRVQGDAGEIPALVLFDAGP